MANVTLPQGHRAADLELATRIVTCLELEELHVFEPLDAVPEGALPADPAPAPPAPAPARPRGRSLAARLDALLERVADRVAPWTSSARQPRTGKLRREASRSTPA